VVGTTASQRRRALTPSHPYKSCVEFLHSRAARAGAPGARQAVFQTHVTLQEGSRGSLSPLPYGRG
jgi:hypothetical protein